MKRLLIIKCFLLLVFFGKAQKDTLACKGLPIVSVSLSIQNYAFVSDSITISVDSIRAGFKLSLLDKSFKVIGYRAYYETDNSDVYFRDIYGDSVDQINFPILKNVKKGALIFLECINISKDKRRYSTKPLIIYII